MEEEEITRSLQSIDELEKKLSLYIAEYETLLDRVIFLLHCYFRNTS